MTAERESKDERAAAEALLPQIYEELRALAGGFLRAERAEHTLQPTALVHEAYLRVLEQSRVTWKNPGHLRAVSAQAMRRVLVDHARAKKAAKRGAGLAAITLASEIMGDVGESALDALALEEALVALTERNERQARIVELRFFGGMTNREVAEELGVSETTVEDDWRFARAWLNRELSG
ncbi:MAG: ECF-type sigma factor [Planctomycetota bacterium]|jgi:RNA polymerase sigma factor (TIGR02999 family)